MYILIQYDNQGNMYDLGITFSNDDDINDFFSELQAENTLNDQFTYAVITEDEYMNLVNSGSIF